MRRPRVKIEGEGFYHVVSRIGGKRFLLDDAEKSVLLGMIRGAAAFSGVELYTFAIMDNHFHLLVRVPGKREVSDGELLRRMRALYGPAKFAAILEKWEKWEKKDQSWREEDEKARLRARMYDLSQFCKTFKEAYTQDYNRRHNNTGTIWEGRFKSILLEGSHRALMTVAGYVHLNPVRAAVAERPEDADWTGYGAGCKGDTRARKSLCRLVSRACRAKNSTWVQARAACAEAMEGKMPGRPETLRPDPSPDPGGAPCESLGALLRRRVAGFLHGGALGGAAFLECVAGAFLPRMRRKSLGLLDRCLFLGLVSAAGVRGAS